MFRFRLAMQRRKLLFEFAFAKANQKKQTVNMKPEPPYSSTMGSQKTRLKS